VPLIRQVVLAAVAAATVVFVADRVRPIYVGQTSVAQRVLQAAYVDSSEIRTPWLRVAPEIAVRGQQFMRDRQAFTTDLLHTGKLTLDRAERIADAAVRQAYHERVPPALVLGVMLTENGEFKPRSRSNVGAVGLMQIMPRHWVPALGRKFGRDLKDDATNVRYGVFILGHWTRSVPDSLDEQASWRRALLRYNGCVRGSNTRGCQRYPDVVRRHVQASARASCGGRSFEECVVWPMVRSIRTEKPELPALLAHLAEPPAQTRTVAVADGEVERAAPERSTSTASKARSSRTARSSSGKAHSSRRYAARSARSSSSRRSAN
jgi:hypothetical protein